MSSEVVNVSRHQLANIVYIGREECFKVEHFSVRPSRILPNANDREQRRANLSKEMNANPACPPFIFDSGVRTSGDFTQNVYNLTVEVVRNIGDWCKKSKCVLR